MLLDKLIIPDMPQLGDVISLIYVEDDLQEENSDETNKGKVAVGDEVLIRYADENIIQREDKVAIECEYMVK